MQKNHRNGQDDSDIDCRDLQTFHNHMSCIEQMLFD